MIITLLLLCLLIFSKKFLLGGRRRTFTIATGYDVVYSQCELKLLQL
jgi:hypothetical protein